MKQTILTFLISLFVIDLSGQTSYSNIEIKLKTTRANNLTELTCTGDDISIKFQLKQKSVSLQNNFAFVDSQVIQISPLKVSGYAKNVGHLDSSGRKQLLEEYSKYELDYFQNDLHVEIINPSSQWVINKSGGWLVWYFRVGNSDIIAGKKTENQLFASTVIGNKILTINAPIFAGGNFRKAALIVNEMMESLTNHAKK